MVKFSEKLKRCGEVVEIPVNSIRPNPHQPRKTFEWGDLEELAQSIYQNGLLQPITVRELGDGKFELIAGERRLRASKMAGLSAIPSIVVTVSEEKSAVLAVIENLQRQDLHFFEEAAAISELARDFGMDRDKIAKKLGKSPSAVSNKLRLLKLPSEIQKRIISGGLTERHARSLLRLTDFELMSSVVEAVVTNRLNVAETELLVEGLLQNSTEEPEQKQKKKTARAFKDVKIILNTLDRAVATIRKNGIDAISAHRETDLFVEYVVRIQKNEV
ncbi:MAG: ParB/RepB/Spo0J family partition protein [Clostridia bacterium]|nr:ParB/RepB/Spo0J family partition protein [Clostridia bacterium]